MKLLDCDKISRYTIQTIFEHADRYLNNKGECNDCMGKILCNAFNEQNQHSNLYFEAAMYKLGGKVITYNNKNTFTQTEQFNDTNFQSKPVSNPDNDDMIRVLEQISDILILHNDSQESMKKISQQCKIPVINACNGEHPSQALLDLFTLHKHFDIENEQLKILFVGDAKYSHSIHMLQKLLNLYPNIHVSYFPYDNDCICPNIIQNYDDIHTYDAVYCTPFPTSKYPSDYNVDLTRFVMTNTIANKMNTRAIIMHPLPRNNELQKNVDNNHRSVYFKQVKYGLYIRMSIIYTTIFNLLDNSFYTLEYNYLNQLRSEIHLW